MGNFEMVSLYNHKVLHMFLFGLVYIYLIHWLTLKTIISYVVRD